MDTDSKLAIACNIAIPTKECVKGALAYVINDNPGSGGESMEIYARSRSGRWIRKWERRHRLMNFRVKTIPPENPKYEIDEIFLLNSVGKDHLVEWAKWNTEWAELERSHRAEGHRKSFDNCDECKSYK